MAVVKHDGSSIPTVSDPFSVGDKDWIWMDWTDFMNSGSFVSSTWSVPSAATNHATREGQTVQDENGTSYDNTNGILLEFSTQGGYIVSNTVEISSNGVTREFTRSAKVVVLPL